MQLNTQDAFFRAMGELFPDQPPAAIGAAVSGGGDSIALLQLINIWARDNNCILRAATVDHGLRDGSAGEARQVAELCAQMGVPHATLTWTGWNKKRNLQMAARNARLALIGDWARAHGLTHVATGHTQDDQAETVLMRLARGSGVDGLAAIPRQRNDVGFVWFRPLLALGREELRAYLRQERMNWIDDPSNDNEQFDRIKIRKAMNLLAELGITSGGLAGTAQRMASVQLTLNKVTHTAARDVVTFCCGDIILDRQQYSKKDHEIRRRLLQNALNWVSGEVYGPRAGSLLDLDRAIENGTTATLHGCIVMPESDRVIISREYAEISSTTCKTTEIWDNRWQVLVEQDPGFVVRALGPDGLAQCADWKDFGRPRAAMMASPSVWSGTHLLHACVSPEAAASHFRLTRDENDFYSAIISH